MDPLQRARDGGTVKVLDVAELVAERLKWLIFIFDRHGSRLAGNRTSSGNHWDQELEM
jgi:hypothetical protein